MTFDEWWKTQGLDNEWVKSWAQDAWAVAQVQCDLEVPTPQYVSSASTIEMCAKVLEDAPAGAALSKHNQNMARVLRGLISPESK